MEAIYKMGANKGFLQGATTGSLIPHHAGGDDPAYDGAPLLLDSSKESSVNAYDKGMVMQGGNRYLQAVPDRLIDVWPNTITLDVGGVGAIMQPVVQFRGTINTRQSVFGAVFFLALFHNQGIFKNDNAVAANLGNIASFVDQATYEADGQTITTASQFGFRAISSYAVINSGTLSATSYTGYAFAPAVGASSTVTTMTGLSVSNPTNSGTITTLIGVDIANLTSGGTNIGIRNKGSTQLGTSAQTVIGTAGTFTTFAGFADNINIAVGTTNGTQIATTTSQKIGFFGTTPAIQQTQGATLTNNVTSGGSANTIANFTSLTTYSTDAATIRNDIYQLSQTLKIVVDALRTYGLLS